MEILELELVESNPSAIGEAVFNDRPSCFVNHAGQVAIVLEGKVHQNWNPRTRIDHAWMVVEKITLPQPVRPGFEMPPNTIFGYLFQTMNIWP